MLGLGLGRAILFLREHDARPHRDAILHACTHWTGYDQQVEGTRTTYLRDVLNATGHERAFVPHILAALKRATDRRDATQLAFLALSFANDGYAEARSALYEKFDRNDTAAPFLGYDAIIRLDGIDGLLHVAERAGTALIDGTDVLSENDWVLRSAVEQTEEHCGKEAVQEALARAAQENPSIRAYVSAIEAVEAEDRARDAARSDTRTAHPQQRRNQGSIHTASYDRVKQEIAEASPPWRARGLMRWGEQASADDLARAAADLLAEQDDGRIRAYLEMFRRRAFPLDIGRLLNLMRHPNDRIMVAAAQMLSQVRDPQVRALALQMAANSALEGWRKSWGVGLLLSNFEPGDGQVLARLLDEPHDEMGHHSLGSEIVKVVEANLVPETAPVLRLLYERGTCTFCRGKAVVLLRKLGALPAWMLDECQYDASLDLREKAEAWARGDEPAVS